MYVCVPLMPLQIDFFLGGGYLFVYLFPVWLVQYVCLCVCTCVCVFKREREFLDVNVLSAIHGVNSGQCVVCVSVSESERECVCPCAAVC